MRKISASSRINAKGNAPAKISNREIEGSLSVLLRKKQDIPNGGSARIFHEKKGEIPYDPCVNKVINLQGRGISP